MYFLFNIEFCIYICKHNKNRERAVSVVFRGNGESERDAAKNSGSNYLLLKNIFDLFKTGIGFYRCKDLL